MLAVFRNVVGVWEARHVSSVVCLPFPGEAITDVPRVDCVIRVIAFLGRACDGESWAGDLAKSKVSIVSIGDGEPGRSIPAVRSAGSVFARCIGARRLRFVTLAGSSSNTGASDLSRVGDITEGLLSCRTGEEDTRSISVVLDRAGGGCTSLLDALDDARSSFDPGLVTFAKA